MTVQLKDYFTVRPQSLGFLLTDAVVMAFAYFFAFLLRFDFSAPWWGWNRVSTSFVTVWAVQTGALALFGCYRMLWRYVSINDFHRFVGALASSTVILAVLRFALPNHFGVRPPYSITLINSILALGGLLCVRLIWRILTNASMPTAAAQQEPRRILLIGAGDCGNLIARELKQQSNLSPIKIVGFLDDDPAKQTMKIQGFPVLGTIENLRDIAQKISIDEVIVTMTRAPRTTMRTIVSLCEQTNIPSRIMPGYLELIQGTVTVSRLRKLDVTDLLGRKETITDTAAIISLISQRRVLITGAGGSIGSELVHQVLHAGPSEVILVDHAENALYEIDRAARHRAPNSTTIVSILADCGDRTRMAQIFAKHQPHLVIHAAAYKHVPMMEQNPIEAIMNNVQASRTLGELAKASGVERFVLISTDKAVNPVSVMGASKRLAEMVLQDLNAAGSTLFCAVRFGNVLDSSGSVVPLFREQIQRGEAVTITHPDMRRYFMTISEAVSLVLQAATLAQGGEIFVLDMGEPIRILELAEDMIALSGLRPYEDIPIVFTGIRAGEKLFEELDVSERSAYKTGHAQVFISKIPRVSPAEIERILSLCAHWIRETKSPVDLCEQILTLATGTLSQKS